MSRELLHGVPYNPDYPWRPKYAWDSCPACFENFDFEHKCTNCGSGEENSVKLEE